MKSTFNLGDTVSGVYCGVAFTGLLHSYMSDGSFHVTFPAPHAKPVVFGIPRDGIYFEEYTDARAGLRLVSRPAAEPVVRLRQNADGAYLV